MPGFTAINARTSEAPAPIVDAAAEAAVSGPRKATERRQPARKKPAAQKNGGQEAADATAPDRISGKVKKRANHPSDEPEPKRRKSGSLKSSMPTKKTAVSATTTADPHENLDTKVISSSSTDAGLVSLTSMAKLSGFRYTRAQAAASVGGEPQSIQPNSVSYVPETSMSTVSTACSSSAHIQPSLPTGPSLSWQIFADLLGGHGGLPITDCFFSYATRYLRLPCKPYETHQEVSHFSTQALQPYRRPSKASGPPERL